VIVAVVVTITTICAKCPSRMIVLPKPSHSHDLFYHRTSTELAIICLLEGHGVCAISTSRCGALGGEGPTRMALGSIAYGMTVDVELRKFTVTTSGKPAEHPRDARRK
jgi:hypothetical protein